MKYPKPKRRIRTFEADEDVGKMLDAAIDAGLTLGSLVNDALREVGPEMLSRKSERIRKIADKSLKNKPEDKH